MALYDKIVPLIGQAIAAYAVIQTNDATVKKELAPIIQEQTIAAMKIQGLSEKVSRIEKKVGD